MIGIATLSARTVKLCKVQAGERFAEVSPSAEFNILHEYWVSIVAETRSDEQSARIGALYRTPENIAPSHGEQCDEDDGHPPELLSSSDLAQSQGRDREHAQREHVSPPTEIER